MSAPQSIQLNPPVSFELVASDGFVFAPGSTVCTVKIMLELGKRIPRMTCARFPTGGNEGPSAAAVAGFVAITEEAGQRIPFNDASSPRKSARPDGNFPA